MFTTLGTLVQFHSPTCSHIQRQRSKGEWGEGDVARERGKGCGGGVFYNFGGSSHLFHPVRSGKDQTVQMISSSTAVVCFPYGQIYKGCGKCFCSFTVHQELRIGYLTEAEGPDSLQLLLWRGFCVLQFQKSSPFLYPCEILYAWQWLVKMGTGCH